MWTKQQECDTDMCNQRDIAHLCLQTATEFISGGSSAPVFRGRNLGASLVTDWRVHVTQNKHWQAGHSNPDWAKSFRVHLMVVQVHCRLGRDKQIILVLTALLEQFFSGLQLQAAPDTLAFSNFQQGFQWQLTIFILWLYLSGLE